jgi:HEAT repeat protein
VSPAALTRDEALRLLGDSERYCEGARALARLGDRKALLPLAQAYERLEGLPKRCLIEAMQDLDGASASEELFRADDASVRRAAVLLMRLVPDERHLAPLQEALADGDAHVRWHARRAIAAQPRTEAWEEVLVGLLETGEPATRARAAECLADRRSERVRVALERRAVEEDDETVRAALARALQV